MRKGIFILSLVLCIFFALPAHAAPIVILNSRQIQLDITPVVQDDTVFLPLGAIVEPLGAQISWEQATQTVFFKKGLTEIRLYPGRADALINGAWVDLSAPVQAIDGRTMVPLQFFTVALGADASWDSDTQTVAINADVSTSPGIKSAARVHFIDVGQGDAIYIQLPDRIDVLIDGGNLDAEATILRYLQDQNVDDLDLVIASNCDAHHIGALPAVFSQYEVKKLIYNGAPASNVPDNLLNTAQSKNVPIETSNHQTWTWGDAALEILNGPVADGNYQDDSIISRLKVGDMEFLFMSDAGTKAENNLQGDIKAQILKVGDHGSAKATSQEFIDRVKPEAAIITMIGDNPKWYGHDPNTPPAPEVLDRLQKQGAKVFRTDLDGDIVVVTDGQTYQVKASVI